MEEVTNLEGKFVEVGSSQWALHINAWKPPADSVALLTGAPHSSLVPGDRAGSLSGRSQRMF